MISERYRVARLAMGAEATAVARQAIAEGRPIGATLQRALGYTLAIPCRSWP